VAVWPMMERRHPLHIESGTATSTTWSTAARAIPCLRAAGGDRSKDFNFNIDYMVNCRPRDSLSEGRGW
jgi:hypothetical protein